jgi:hypothetical protein
MLIQEGEKDKKNFKGKIRGKGYGDEVRNLLVYALPRLPAFRLSQYIYEWILEKEIYDKLTQGVMNVL